jgi:hypothetical protein
MEEQPIYCDWMSKEGRWAGPDCSANLRRLKEQQQRSVVQQEEQPEPVQAEAPVVGREK